MENSISNRGKEVIGTWGKVWVLGVRYRYSGKDIGTEGKQ